MKAAALILSLLLIFSSMGIAQTPVSPAQGAKKKSAGFDPKRDAAKDIQNAIAKAKKEKKRILLDVGGEW